MLLKRRWEHGLPSFICSEALIGGNASSTELAQNWHRIGTELAQNWHRIGTELAQNWHRIGTELALVAVLRRGQSVVDVYCNNVGIAPPLWSVLTRSARDHRIHFRRQRAMRFFGVASTRAQIFC
jgi:hypothetical protein